MSDPLERITELKREVERARNEQARKEAVADQAEAALREALDRLKGLGCDSVEQAQAEIPTLRGELDNQVMRIENLLGEVE